MYFLQFVRLHASERTVASQSIGATQQILARAPANVRSAVEPRADDAYMTSMHDAAVASAAAALLGAIVVTVWLPGNPATRTQTRGTPKPMRCSYRENEHSTTTVTPSTERAQPPTPAPNDTCRSHHR